MANLYNRFEKNPVNVKVPRSFIPLNYQCKTSFDFGQLTPFFLQEVLPGDTFDISTSFVARTQTPLVPVMDNSFLDYYFFFVPNRLTWSHWEELMGANKTGPWASAVEWSVPTIHVLNQHSAPTPLFDRFGVSSASDSDFCFSSLPILGYYEIWNQWFRDENYQNPLSVKIDGSSSFNGFLNYYVTGVPGTLGDLLPVNRFHDYFTSCLPSPQKGTASGVSADIGQIPVYSSAVSVPTPDKSGHGLEILSNSNRETNGNYRLFAHFTSRNEGEVGTQSEMEGTGSNPVVYPSNLFADGSMASNFISVNDMRTSFQVQKMLERDARGGTRYNESLFSHFGVTSPDSRLQIPEYLFGTRVPMHINQVLQTAGNGSTGAVGATYGMSLTSDYRFNFKKSFVEHGFVIGVMCARTEQTYSQGVDRVWSKLHRLDFYTPELANLSEQPVLNKEIYNDPSVSSNEETFGFNEAWADYRSKVNKAVGVFNPSTGALKEWTYANSFSVLPTRLALTKETKANVARTLAVTNADQVFADIYVQNKAIRPMPAYSVPGLIDHH